MVVPAHSRRLFLFAAGLILVGAAVLRFAQIDRRPFHADEGVQAYQTWQLLRGDGYTYDPADKHGPWLYYAAAGIAKISGWVPAALDESRLRSVTLLAGLGTIALMLGAATPLGCGPVLIGAALLAIAPLAVIYDTYFIQEAWFCFFTWALFFAALRWWDSGPKTSSESRASAGGGLGPARAPARQESRCGRSSEPSLTGALLIGALVGLMQATKETSVLHFAALAVALFAIRPLYEIRHFWPRVLPAFGMAALVYVVFYSAFFTRWAGVADGLRAYFHYAGRAAGSAHDQPWSYYLALLWPHSIQGVRWGEPLLLVMALVGMIGAFSSRATLTQRALAVFTMTLLVVYSLIPYKTPWLLLTPYVGLTLLAGLGVIESAKMLPAKFASTVAVLLGAALWLACGWRDFSALDRYANDDRNPYIYQPTSSDLPRLVKTLGAVAADHKIAVVSPDSAWPLPWYLRDRPAVGYFSTPPENLAVYDLILFDSRLETPLSATAFGLRPNVMLWLKPR